MGPVRRATRPVTDKQERCEPSRHSKDPRHIPAVTVAD
jgi:hypothetical protein